MTTTTHTTASGSTAARRAPFPHRYEIDVTGDGTAASVTAGRRPALPGGAPETFGGRDDWWSPEHLLLAAVGLCLKTTFDALAAKDGLAVRAYASHVTGTLDKTTEGLVFTQLVVDVRVAVAPTDVDRAERTLQAAKRWCIVSNALKPHVELRATIATSGERG